ncbi:hypothetical protein DVH24_030483 [Malus domestica]|uniref:Uncharacterized protein n=1 Tax=Malus domestica TaxID=3750 RepID=A0A498K2M2_MALDO|nr:hypothetical protein DVH24_030483 [Malus domestica]
MPLGLSFVVLTWTDIPRSRLDLFGCSCGGMVNLGNDVHFTNGHGKETWYSEYSKSLVIVIMQLFWLVVEKMPETKEGFEAFLFCFLLFWVV